jgi:hypothetical protein
MSIHQSGRQKGARTIMVAHHEGLNFEDTLDILWKLFFISKDRHGGFFEANMEVKWRPFGWVRDPKPEQFMITIEYVIIEYGNWLWEKYRES